MMNKLLTYGELRMLCERIHKEITWKHEINYILETDAALRQQLFDEQALHHATQLRLTAAIESSGKCANRVQALRQQLATMTEERDGIAARWKEGFDLRCTLEQQLAAMTQERDEQCAGKMAFYNGMNDMREQRTKLERQLAKANKVQP